MTPNLAHEEIQDILAARDTGDLELVAYVEELVAAHRATAVVEAALASDPVVLWAAGEGC